MGGEKEGRRGAPQQGLMRCTHQMSPTLRPVLGRGEEERKKKVEASAGEGVIEQVGQHALMCLSGHVPDLFSLIVADPPSLSRHFFQYQDSELEHRK